ncbi:MAG TPA: HEAT repeat domain-containing protein, partial [Gemmatimonadaceae bacterium]
ERGSDDDEMRTQAVFVLTQQSKSEKVPELINLVRNSRYPAVRKAAIFWLGQTGDARAADVYAELLGLR